MRTGAVGRGYDMPFLVLDRNGKPMTDPATGWILHFHSRKEAEAYRKAQNGWRVMEVPSGPPLTQKDLES